MLFIIIVYFCKGITEQTRYLNSFLTSASTKKLMTYYFFVKYLIVLLIFNQNGLTKTIHSRKCITVIENLTEIQYTFDTFIVLSSELAYTQFAEGFTKIFFTMFTTI